MKKANQNLAPYLQPINLAQSPAVQIYEQLKSAILNLRLIPGQNISESEVGKLVNASRTPVREAIAKLREEGMIETHASRGNYITKFDIELIRGAYFVRSAIERANVKYICKHRLLIDNHQELLKNIETCKRCLDQNEVEKFHYFDDEFHILIAKSTGFKRSAVALTREKITLDRLRYISLKDKAHLDMLIDDHQRILEALIKNDIKSALKELDTHLSRVLTTLDDLRAQNQDFFEA